MEHVLPPSLRAHVHRNPGLTPVRYESLHGEVMWRGVPNFRHETLTRAFNLDPASFYFDLPSSIQEGGSSRTGAGSKRPGVINGYVMRGNLTEPWGKLTVVSESDRIRDDDPQDKRDFFNLSRT